MKVNWDGLDMKGRADAVRPLVEQQGMSMGQIGKVFGVSRNVIAGVMSRNAIRGAADRVLTNTALAALDRRKAAAVAAIDRRKAAAVAAIDRRKATVAIDRRQQLAKNRFEKFSGPQFARVVPLVSSKPEAWLALAGSTPKPVEHHLAGVECRWPVYDGDEPKRFCCLPVADNPHYCEAHAAMAWRKVAS